MFLFIYLFYRELSIFNVPVLDLSGRQEKQLQVIKCSPPSAGLSDTNEAHLAEEDG